MKKRTAIKIKHYQTHDELYEGRKSIMLPAFLKKRGFLGVVWRFISREGLSRLNCGGHENGVFRSAFSVLF